MNNKPDLNKIDRLLEKSSGSVISLLQDVQEECGYLPESVLREISRKTGKPPIELYRIATFYKAFSLAPEGKHKITVCSGTACHVRGSENIVREISCILGIEPGSTTPDGEFTFKTVNCLGACALAPVVVVDGKYYGNMTVNKVRNLLRRPAAALR